jgi:hypothetical protein
LYIGESFRRESHVERPFNGLVSEPLATEPHEPSQRGTSLQSESASCAGAGPQPPSSSPTLAIPKETLKPFEEIFLDQ